ncbi:hypothetical protein D9758_000917 [Tetrapyrgos nigripes]|uniref:Uncharacterized protein n=1 Tax=Tetrapyrgos nigripes TaxID=182062 RepID=A0A8H5GZ76_9AGAR|nr:hypothetical protein D9758_000917 [Tetrapyrgos nigripes]
MDEPFSLKSYSSPLVASQTDVYVTVAGDGVHVLDVGELHTILSLNRKATLAKTSVVGSVFTTFAARQNTLVVWTEDVSASIAERAKQKVQEITVDHSIDFLHPSVLQSKHGHLTRLDQTLSVHYPADILASFYFDDCLVSFTTTSVQVVHPESLSLLHDIPIPTPKNILSCTCSQSGFISILLTDGTWSSYQLAPPSLIPLETLTLSSTLSSPSLLSLGSSYVLLASVSNNQVVLLLWDLAFSVLLSSRTIPLPSPSIHPHLVSYDRGNVLLVLSDKKKKSTSLLIIPTSLPLTSSLAYAMSQSKPTEPWLASSSSSHTDLTNSEKNLLASINAKAFFDHVQANSLGYNFTQTLLWTLFGLDVYTPESSKIIQYLITHGLVSSSMVSKYGGLLGVLRVKGDWPTILHILRHSSVPDLTEQQVISALAVVLGNHLRSSASNANDEVMQIDTDVGNGNANTNGDGDGDIPSLVLFLSIILSPSPCSSSSSSPSPTPTPRWLHSQSSLRLALRTALISSLTSSSSSASSTSNSASALPTSSIPTTTTTPTSTLDPLTILFPLFQILIGWVRVHTKISNTALKLPSKKMKKVGKKTKTKEMKKMKTKGQNPGKGLAEDVDDEEVEVEAEAEEPGPQPGEGTPTHVPIPPLQPTLLFLTSLLDVAYPFLSTSTSSSSSSSLTTLLTTLSQTYIPTLLEIIEQGEPLRGALEGFARVASDSVAGEGGEGGVDDNDNDDDNEGVGSIAGKHNKKNDKMKGKGQMKMKGKGKGKDLDWRQRRKMLHEMEGMAVGLYRLEEVVL